MVIFMIITISFGGKVHLSPAADRLG